MMGICLQYHARFKKALQSIKKQESQRPERYFIACFMLFGSNDPYRT